MAKGGKMDRLVETIRDLDLGNGVTKTQIFKCLRSRHGPAENYTPTLCRAVRTGQVAWIGQRFTVAGRGKAADVKGARAKAGPRVKAARAKAGPKAKAARAKAGPKAKTARAKAGPKAKAAPRGRVTMRATGVVQSQKEVRCRIVVGDRVFETVTQMRRRPKSKGKGKGRPCKPGTHKPRCDPVRPRVTRKPAARKPGKSSTREPRGCRLGPIETLWSFDREVMDDDDEVPAVDPAPQSAEGRSAENRDESMDEQSDGEQSDELSSDDEGQNEEGQAGTSAEGNPESSADGQDAATVKEEKNKDEDPQSQDSK